MFTILVVVALGKNETNDLHRYVKKYVFLVESHENE